MGGSQKPWGHLSCCRMSFNTFTQCAPSSWSREGSNLMTVGTKVFGPKAQVGVQLVLHILCRVNRRSVLLEDEVWFFSDLLAPWKNLRLKLACSLVETKQVAASPRSMLRSQTPWLRLDAWFLTLWGLERYYYHISIPDHSVYWRQDKRGKFSHRKKDDSISVILHVIQQTISVILYVALQMLLDHCSTQQGFLEHLRPFPLIFLTILNTVENIFFFCASPVFFGHESFSKAFWWFPGLKPEVFLIEDYLLETDAFKRCSTRWTIILPTFSYFEVSVFLNPAFIKVNFSILLTSVRRYLTFSDFTYM